MSKQGSKSHNQCIITNGSDINSEDHDSCKDGKSDKDIIRENFFKLNPRSDKVRATPPKKETDISQSNQNVLIDVEGIQNLPSEIDANTPKREILEIDNSPENTKLIKTINESNNEKVPLRRECNHSNTCCCNKRKCSAYVARLFEYCRRFFRFYVKALSINGEERVKHEYLEEEDFELDDKIKIALYDENFLKTHWNSAMIKQSLGRRMKASLKNGLIQRTFPIVSVFLFMYYFISIVILSQICCEGGDCGFLDKSSKEMMTRRLAIGKSHVAGIGSDNVTYFCNNYEEVSADWNEKEHRLTRVLTFLVGFYVAFIVRSWWQQVRVWPTTDKASLGMGSFAWVDSRIDESEVNVKVGRKVVPLMQLKKDIMRLFLLSYAMCFCRISIRLKRRLPSAQYFIKKRLLTENEYKLLKTKTKDGWLIKWATPQLWVNQLACNVENKTSLQHLNPHIKDIDKYVKIKEPKEIGIALFKFKDDLQRLSNGYSFRIPSLMRHVIIIALYFYIMMGAVAGQGNIFHLDNKMSLIQKLVSNFPLYYCVKHLLIIGWLKTATDLQNPFGEDE